MKIGLTYTGYEHKHRNYLNWLQGNDPAIEIITLSADKNNSADIADCDGLVLSGGIDSNPTLYAGSMDYPNKPEEGWNMARDLFEKQMYEYALSHSLPILGVCRGLQLVNVLEGGNLQQDLGTLNKSHKAVEELDQSHMVLVETGTLLSEIADAGSGRVNSAHHQSISQLAEDLIINCRAEDGTIEGTEWKDKSGKPFLLCVQWHPERMYKCGLENEPLSKNIRNRFIEEINKSINSKDENH